MTSGKTRTREEIKEIVEKLGYNLLDEYMNKNYRKVIIQDSSGYRYNIQLNDFMRKISPDFVSVYNPFSLFNIRLWIEKENKQFTLCDQNVYKGNKEALFFQCLKESCREIFTMSWTEIYSQGCCCPFCSGHRVGKYNNLAYLRPELAKEWDYDKNEKSPEEYSEFSHTEIFWICSECSHSWSAFINNRSNGTGCPKCNLYKGSKKIHELLSKWGIKFKAEFPLEDCKHKGQLYLDFYLTDLKTGIEYNGHQHYQPVRFSYSISKKQAEKRFRTQKIRDGIKEKYCMDNGISLIVIPYWDFNRIEEILSNYIFKNTLDK